MTAFAALLRAVNVGGSGKLPMSDLRELCKDAGFTNVTTFIQSGNVVFSSKLPLAKVHVALESALQKKLGKSVGVYVRTGSELDVIVRENPFPRAAPNQVLIFFLEEPLAKDALVGIKLPGKELVEVRGREVYVHYPDGQGRSKLKLPFASVGTGRNLNTVTKLAELLNELSGG